MFSWSACNPSSCSHTWGQSYIREMLVRCPRIDCAACVEVTITGRNRHKTSFGDSFRPCLQLQKQLQETDTVDFATWKCETMNTAVDAAVQGLRERARRL